MIPRRAVTCDGLEAVALEQGSKVQRHHSAAASSPSGFGVVFGNPAHKLANCAETRAVRDVAAQSLRRLAQHYLAASRRCRVGAWAPGV
jgi:hypothetical protein